MPYSYVTAGCRSTLGYPEDASVLATDRAVLVDLENVVGFRPKLSGGPCILGMTALLDAVGAHHHVVAAYDTDDDATA